MKTKANQSAADQGDRTKIPLKSLSLQNEYL